MNSKILTVGSAIEHWVIETFPDEYLYSVFSENMGVDDLVDQIILELIKYSYEETAERHSIREYLKQLGEYTDDIRVRYSRLIGKYNDNREQEISFVKRSMRLPVDENASPPKMEDISNKREGYQLTPIQFLELRNMDEIELIKAIITHRIGSSHSISNDVFYKIASQYDKMVLSLKEKSTYSDEDMVFNCLAYFAHEWRYSFDFLYACAEYMIENKKDDSYEFFAVIKDLVGYKATYPFWGGSVLSYSRMVGYREKLIPFFMEDGNYSYRYEQFISIMTKVKEDACIEDVPIKKWFIDNTTIDDWASFLREYDVFKHWKVEKKYSGKTIRKIRELFKLIFPDNSEGSEYIPRTLLKDDDIIAKQVYEEAIMMSKLSCYIEEYYNDNGTLCARIRDKVSNKRIVIWSNDKGHFLRFLSSAKKYYNLMPTIFDKDGTDIIVVHGLVESENDEIIEVRIDAPGAGYLFQ